MIGVEGGMALLGWRLEVDGRIWLESVLGQGLTLAVVRKGRERRRVDDTRAQIAVLTPVPIFIPGRLAPRRCRWPGSRKYA